MTEGLTAKTIITLDDVKREMGMLKWYELNNMSKATVKAQKDEVIYTLGRYLKSLETE